MTTQELQTVAQIINKVRIIGGGHHDSALDDLSARLGKNCVPPVELDQFLASCGCRNRQATV